MRDRNWYTLTLFTTGLLALFGAAFQISNMNRWLEFLAILALIVILDLFPIKLPSGVDFSASTIGNLYLLFSFGLVACVISDIISTLIAFLKRSGSIRKINYFRFFVTLGMYFWGNLAALAVIQGTEESLNLVIRVFLAACVFEVVNIMLIAGIGRTVMGIPLFHNFSAKLKELVVPVLVCLIVVPRLLAVKNPADLVVEVLYTIFFLLVIIFFSTQFIKQITVRQNISKGFISLLESRIASAIAGHGARVGMICESLVEDLGYPKNKKHDLIQLAIIHDIGKSLLPSHVLNKRGALTLSEEQEYRSHCEKGAEIVRSIFPKDPFADWILYHHERWDGKGFPKGLKGEEIPLESRILALCNHLDHIMKRHSDDETAYRLLQELGGTVLDPSLVEKITQDTVSHIRLCLPAQEGQMLEKPVGAEPESEVKSHIGQSFFLRYTADNQLLGEASGLPKEKLSSWHISRKHKVHPSMR